MSTRTALAVLEVRKPCLASWEAMAGDDVARFCTHCQKHVHNLSEMTTDDAERLLCENAGSLCVRFEKAANGQIVTLDYRQRFALKRTWRIWAFIGLLAAGAAGIADALAIYRKQTTPVKTFLLGSSM